MDNNIFRTGFTSDAGQWCSTNIDIMKPKEIGFVNSARKWQCECFDALADSNKISIINAPTGSGKSTMLSMLAYHRTLQNSKQKTIIAVPQTVIGKGFNTKTFKMPNNQIIEWAVGTDLCSNPKNTIEQFHRFIKEDIFYAEQDPFERILVCTHATLVLAFQKLSQEDKEKYWNELLICIDETHHIQIHELTDDVFDMNSLGQLITYSYKNNNSLILISATLFRGDQKNLLSDDILNNATKYNLPFDRYMAEMKYLKSFSYDFAIDSDEYTNDISKCINNLFNENLKKLFIYIPHPKSYMSSGDKYKEIQYILEHLKSNLNGDKIILDEKTGIYHITNNLGLDYKVCDLVDETLSKRTVKFVNNEIINKNPDALDCVIALNRAKEGFDWEHANGMIVVGQRSSLTDVIQMVGRLLRDKQNKEKVKALHMLPFSPNQPIAPNLDNSLNDFFKAIAISLLMEDVFSPSQIQTNDNATSNGLLSGNTSSANNIFDDLELDENLRTDLFNTTQKALVNIAGGLVESQGTYTPEQLKEQMPTIMKQWLNENNILASESQIEALSNKIYNQFAKRSLQMRGINVSDIDWQMIESVDPIEFTLRYVGKDTTLESLKELRRLIAYGESESNKICHVICQRIIVEGYPKIEFIDNVGINHYSWIHRKKQAKQNKGELAWYESDKYIADSYGLFDLFELIDNKQINLNNTQYCIDYYKINGKYPTRWSGTKQDKKIAEWLTRQKSSNKKNEFFNLCFEFAKSKGHPDLFKNQNREEEMLEKINSLFEWIDENSIPKKNSTGDEKTYYNLIMTLRKAKSGKSDNVWYPSFDILFEQNNMWNLLISDDEKEMEKFLNFKKFVEDNKRMPKSNSDDEKQMYGFFKRLIKKNKFTPEIFMMIEDLKKQGLI